MTGTFECLQRGWEIPYVYLTYSFNIQSEAGCAQLCLDYGPVCEGYLRGTYSPCMLMTAPLARTSNSNNGWGNIAYSYYGNRVCLRTRSTRQLFGDAAAAPPVPPPPPAPPSPPPPFWLAGNLTNTTIGNLTSNSTGNGTYNGTALAPPPFYMDVDVGTRGELDSRAGLQDGIWCHGPV